MENTENNTKVTLNDFFKNWNKLVEYLRILKTMETNMQQTAEAAPGVDTSKPIAWIVNAGGWGADAIEYADYRRAQQKFWKTMNEIENNNRKWDENFKLETPTPLAIDPWKDACEIAEEWYKLNLDDTFDYLGCPPEEEPAQFKNMLEIVCKVQDIMVQGNMHDVVYILVWSDCALHHSMDWTGWGQRQHTQLEFRGEKIEIEPIYAPGAQAEKPLYDATDEAFDADYRTKKAAWNRAEMS